MPWAESQVSFLKDLVCLRNPRSRFTFLNYLHSVGRLNDFVNLATFTPYRVEISGYLRWVADSLEHVGVEYGRRCVDVDVRRDRSGRVAGWSTNLADGSVIHSEVLVVGIGRDPHVPAPFLSLPPERVVHSTRYLQRMAELTAKPPDERPNRIAVVGGAQSSAEMLAAVLRELPDARLTALMRSVGFTAYQTSKFTNELYYPTSVDDFYNARPEAQRQVLREMHNTNYAGLAPALLETLYRQFYLERLGDKQHTDIRTMTDVTAARMERDDIVLTLYDRRTGRVDEMTCDLVLLGTGYARQMPAMVRRLAGQLGLSTVKVTRNYRLVFDSDRPVACYLQGVNEATHGIADSLLSVVATRTAEIAMDIVAHRREPVSTPSAVPSFTSP